MRTLLLDHIVLADDDQDHRFLFERVLKQVDPTKSLSSVKDGVSLFAFLTCALPEILFLDLNMPNKHGLECLQEIRSNPDLDRMKVVVYSSSSQMTNIHQSYHYKADLYIVKPFNTEHLKNALDIVLNRDLWQSQAIRNHYFINNRFVPYTA